MRRFLKKRGEPGGLRPILQKGLFLHRYKKVANQKLGKEGGHYKRKNREIREKKVSGEKIWRSIKRGGRGTKRKNYKSIVVPDTSGSKILRDNAPTANIQGNEERREENSKKKRETVGKGEKYANQGKTRS